MNWKGYGRKRSWANLRYHPDIWLKVLRKPTRNLNQCIRSADQDLNPGPHEYERGVPTILLWRSIPNYSVRVIYYSLVTEHTMLIYFSKLKVTLCERNVIHYVIFLIPDLFFLFEILWAVREDCLLISDPYRLQTDGRITLRWILER
jgi:hypothetical protein